MNDAVAEVKKKLDIVEFIGSFVTLKKAGRNFKGICPFHSEKTPSFVVSPERQIWHCFGSCQDGGDVIKFLMRWENITFFEALQDLAAKVNVKIEKTSLEDKAWQKKDRLLQANRLAAEYFAFVLHKTDYGKRALEYLESRSIKPKTAHAFQLGYAPMSWNSLLSFLKKKKFTEEELQDAGLVVRGERGSLYDRFRGRLVFPLQDARGNTIGFSGRALDEKEKAAKYINTPETLIYHKRESLYGINLTKEAIKKEGNVFITEGEFDVIAPYQYGYENFVAIKGSAVTKEQLMLLKRYSNRVTLTLDADESGEEAIKRGIEEAERLDLDIEIVQFDWAKDPDEAVRANQLEFKKALKKKTPIYDFVIASAQKKYSSEDAFDKKKIADEALPYIERIQNPIVRSHYIKKLSVLLDVTERSLELQIGSLKRRKKQQQFLKREYKSDVKPDREKSIQAYLLSVLFQDKEPYVVGRKIFAIIQPDEFSTLSYTKISAFFIESEKKSNGAFQMRQFSDALPAELRSVFDELYLYATYEGEEEKNIEKLALEAKKLSLKRQISAFMKTEETLTESQENLLKGLSLQLKDVEKKIVSV